MKFSHFRCTRARRTHELLPWNWFDINGMALYIAYSFQQVWDNHWASHTKEESNSNHLWIIKWNYWRKFLPLFIEGICKCFDVSEWFTHLSIFSCWNGKMQFPFNRELLKDIEVNGIKLCSSHSIHLCFVEMNFSLSNDIVSSWHCDQT